MYFTVSQLAKTQGISKGTIYNWISVGWLKKKKLGGSIRISAEAWAEFEQTSEFPAQKLAKLPQREYLLASETS